MKELHLRVVDIPYGQLEANAENPNVMSAAAERALKDDIERRGFVQPVLVRPHPDGEDDHYEIIDGEHRWRILGELGAETVPSVIDDESSDTDADVRRLTMNQLRGEFVPIRLAHLLADLRERIPESELAGRLALERGDLDNLFELASYLEDGADGGAPGPGGVPPQDDRVELVFICDQRQAKRIEELLKQLTNDDPEREAAVLSRLARQW